MNIESVSTDKIQETNNRNQNTQNNTEETTSFSEEYQLLLAQNGINTGFIQGLNDINMVSSRAGGLLTGIDKIHTSFNYDTLTISKEDAMFFSELVEKTDFIAKENGNANSFQVTLLKVVNDANAQNLKSTEISKSLMNLIEEAYRTNKPMRIDFDNNVSVILRIGKDGKVNAEFIPSDRAVEQYLRNNIGYLKDKLDEQNIDYGDIMYKPYKDNSKKQRNNQNGGKQNE